MNGLARRLWLYGSGGLTLLLLLAALALAWLGFTSAGARWALAQLPRLAPVQLDYQSLRGNLWQGLDLQQLTLEGQGLAGFERAELASLQLRWQPLALLAGQLIVDRLELTGGQLYLSAAEAPGADPVFSPPHLDLPITVRLARLRSRDLVLHRAGEALTLPDLQAGLLLAGDQLRLSGLELRHQGQDYRLNARLRLAARLEFELALLSHGITGSGQCQGPRLTCQGRLRWQGLEHPLLAPVQLPQGDLHWQWRAPLLKLAGKLQLQLPAAQLDSELALEGELDLAQARARLQSLSGQYGGGTVQAHGQLQWAQGFSSELELSARAVSLAGWLPDLGVQPGLDLTGALKLAVDDAGLQLLSLDAPALALQLGGQPLAGQLALRLTPDALQIPTLALSAAGTELTLNGSWQFDRQLALSGALNSEALAQWLPGLAGRARLALNARGPLDRLQVNADLTGRQLRWQQTRVDELESLLELTLAADAAGTEALLNSLALAQLRLTARGLQQADRALGDLALQASGTSLQHSLSLISTGLPVRQLAARGGLAPATGRWRGRLTELSLLDALTPAPWTLRQAVDLGLSADGLALDNACLSQLQAWFCVDQLALAHWQDFTLRARLGGLYLDRQRSLYPRWRDTLPDNWRLRGELVGQLSARGQLADAGLAQLSLEATLRALGAGMEYQQDAQGETLLDLPVESLVIGLRGDEQALTLAGELTLAGQQPLQLTGQARQWQGSQRQLALGLTGQLNQLALLQPLLPEARQLSGRAEADLAMAWSAEGPRFEGGLRLMDLGLQLPASGTRLSGWQLQLQAQQRALQLAGEGLIGEGRARLTGQVNARPDSLFDARLAIDGQALKLVDLPDTQLTASPALSLSGDGRHWQLAGELSLHDSLVRLRELPKSASRVSEDARVYGLEQPEPPRHWLSLSTDVRLRLTDAVRFEGFGLTTHLQGELRFRRSGQADNQVQGLVRLPAGRYRSYGQRLDIESGQLTFTGPMDNPGLDVRAARKVGEVTAGVWLTGTAKHPKTQLYSVPPMSEADALAYIVTGKPLTASGEGEVMDMQAAALNLGLKQALPTLQAVGAQLGLTDIGLEEGEDGGSSLAAGKRIGDRLYLKYVYGLMGAAGNFVVQYRLTDRLDIQTSSGETQAIDLTYSWDSTPP